MTKQRKPGKRTKSLTRAEAVLVAIAESFGEFASMCFAGGKYGQRQ